LDECAIRLDIIGRLGGRWGSSMRVIPNLRSDFGMRPRLESLRRRPWRESYNERVEKKIFWIVFMVLGLVADIILPLWWGVVATIPIAFVSWWVAYRSEWF
jgi:hypothetical protein